MARKRYDGAKAKRDSLWQEIEITREEIDRIMAESIKPPATIKSAEPNPSQDEDSKPEPEAPTPPFAHRPSIRATVRVIPLDGDIGTAQIREALGLSEGATHTRLTKAKRAGLVVSAGWGRYKLTEEGKKIHGPVLKAVPADGK